MDFEKLYIDGQWISGASGTFIEIENPAEMKPFARVPAGNAADVDAAARAGPFRAGQLRRYLNGSH